MCSSMKQPKPERLVEMLGIPITVHSAAHTAQVGDSPRAPPSQLPKTAVRAGGVRGRWGQLRKRPCPSLLRLGILNLAAVI